MIRFLFRAFFLPFFLVPGGCIVAPQVDLFRDASEPLQEYRLSGTGTEKVLLIPITGVISDEVEDRMLKSRPGRVQEVVSQLDLARRDEDVGAVVLKIDSAGGSVTASDVLYEEISKFKKDTGIAVVAAMMNFAASGGYYIALPADYILAHPTTVTGSVGVVFLRPDIAGLMEKIGVDVHVNASGEYKDMGSIYRSPTREEDLIFRSLVETLGDRFVDKVKRHRNLSGEAEKDIRSARIYLADEAMEAGLVDGIGYLPDAFARARTLAGLQEDARVVVYRRTYFANDNIYNPVQTHAGPPSISEIGLSRYLRGDRTGFYYLWVPGAGR